MLCPACANQLPADAKLCDKCGSPVNVVLSPAATVPANAQLEKLKAEHPDLVGVRGWLWFFCFTIAILAPLQIIGEASDSKNVVVWIIGTALALWYIFTGVTILREGERALRYVAIVLIIQFCLGALTVVAGIAGSDALSSYQPNPLAGLAAIVGSIIWYLYFHFSRRVHLTFERNL
jgi:hypothetical protein